MYSKTNWLPQLSTLWVKVNSLSCFPILLPLFNFFHIIYIFCEIFFFVFGLRSFSWPHRKADTVRRCYPLLLFWYVFCFLTIAKFLADARGRVSFFFCSWFSVFVCQFFTEKPTNPTRSHPFRVKRLQTTLVFFAMRFFIFYDRYHIHRHARTLTHTHMIFLSSFCDRLRLELPTILVDFCT